MTEQEFIEAFGRLYIIKLVTTLDVHPEIDGLVEALTVKYIEEKPAW